MRRRVAWDARGHGRLGGGGGRVLRERQLSSSARRRRSSTSRSSFASAPREVREAARVIARPERLDVVAVGLLEDGEDERLAEVVEGWSGPR